MTCRRLGVLHAAIALLALTGAAKDGLAQPGGPASRGVAGLPASAMPQALRDVGFDQRLSESVPLDLPFRDENGRTVRLGEYFGSKPVVLALVYYGCPNLCTQVLNGLAGSLKALSLGAGKDFTVLAVSFDPKETPQLAAEKKQTYLERYGRPGAEQGWHLLTSDEASIHALTQAVGFRYVWDPAIGQFAHPAGVTVLTPGGVVARYFFGIEYAPRDLRLALVEASANRIGTPIDRILLYCYLYDPTTGKYGLIAMRLIRLGGIATVLALGMFIVVMWRREARQSTVNSRQSRQLTVTDD